MSQKYRFKFSKFFFTPIKGKISDSQPHAGGGGGAFWPASGNHWKCAVRSHIAKSYFETYRIYDHMQKINPKSRLQRYNYLDLLWAICSLPPPDWVWALKILVPFFLLLLKFCFLDFIIIAACTNVSKSEIAITKVS